MNQQTRMPAVGRAGAMGRVLGRGAVQVNRWVRRKGEEVAQGCGRSGVGGVIANFPTCQLSDLSVCRRVGRGGWGV